MAQADPNDDEYGQYNDAKNEYQNDNQNEANETENGDNQHLFETNWKETVDSFEDMNLKEELLRGIFGHGFEKPSAIQQRAIIPVIKSCVFLFFVVWFFFTSFCMFKSSDTFSFFFLVKFIFIIVCANPRHLLYHMNASVGKVAQIAFFSVAWRAFLISEILDSLLAFYFLFFYYLLCFYFICFFLLCCFSRWYFCAVFLIFFLSSTNTNTNTNKNRTRHNCAGTIRNGQNRNIFNCSVANVRYQKSRLSSISIGTNT